MSRNQILSQEIPGFFFTLYPHSEYLRKKVKFADMEIPGMLKPKTSNRYVSNLMSAIKVKPMKVSGTIGGVKDIQVDMSAWDNKSLLSPGETNAKTSKNWRRSFILYLTPASKSGTNLCPMATPGCIFSCLNTAGRGAMKNVSEARLMRTKFYLQFEQKFMEILTRDITKYAKSTPRKKYKIADEVAFRLNGTSDIPILEMLNKGGYLDQIKKAVPNATKRIVFYDYTKFPNRAGVHNVGGFQYYVTFSRAENYTDKSGKYHDNGMEAINQLSKGRCVAVVFNRILPKFWMDYKVLDGDDRDDLMIDVYRQGDKYGNVLGLKAKGKAKKPKAGEFVVDCSAKANQESCYII
jgi:hypothetical protein